MSRPPPELAFLAVANNWFRRGVSKEQIATFETWANTRLQETLKIDCSVDTPNNPIERQIHSALKDPNQVVSISQLDRDLLPSLSEAQCHLKEVTIVDKGSKVGEISISNQEIERLVIYSPYTKTVLSRCYIAKLVLNRPVNAEIRDCMVRELEVDGFESLRWWDGYLGKADFSEINIRGDVRFVRLTLNKDRDVHGTHWLRKTRATFVENHNPLAAGAFHATELIHDRMDQPLAARIVSWVYEAGSNFGGSIGRAALWVVAAFLSVFLAAFFGGTQASADAVVGWHSGLQGSEAKVQVVRSAIYALDCIFNPLNLIVSKPLVTASYWGGAVLCSLIGLVGTISFALFLLSIRRRFKLE